MARETPRWNDRLAFGLIVIAVAVAVGPDLAKGRPAADDRATTSLAGAAPGDPGPRGNGPRGHSNDRPEDAS